MTKVTLEEAKRRLLDLILETAPGGAVEIVMDDQVIAKLVRPPISARLPGTAKGSILYMAPDFDEPLEDFKDYMG